MWWIWVTGLVVENSGAETTLSYNDHSGIGLAIATTRGSWSWSLAHDYGFSKHERSPKHPLHSLSNYY